MFFFGPTCYSSLTHWFMHLLNYHSSSHPSCRVCDSDSWTIDTLFTSHLLTILFVSQLSQVPPDKWLGSQFKKDTNTSPTYLSIHSLMYICGNKMPTRCNRGFYCRSYCLLNMFQAPQCPSSGAQEYYTVVAACGIWCCGFQVVGYEGWGLCVWFAGCCSILQTRHITLSSTPDQLLEKTTAQNTTRSNHCIILLSSWWWA